MSVSTVTLIVLRCADVERARSFYEVLGLHLVAEQHGAGPAHYSAKIGDTILELYPRRSEESRGVRLGLMVSNVAEIMNAMARVGGKVVSFDPGAQRPSGVVKDPDGHTIELVQELR